MQAKCIEVAVAIIYIVLVSMFLGWGFVHRRKERAPVSSTKPLISATDAGIIRQINKQKDDNVPMQVPALQNISMDALFASSFWDFYASRVLEFYQFILI